MLGLFLWLKTILGSLVAYLLENRTGMLEYSTIQIV